MKKSLLAFLAVAFALSVAACTKESKFAPDCTKDKTDVRCQNG